MQSILLRISVIHLSVTFGMTSATMFYYTKVMAGLFAGTAQVAKAEDLWGVRVLQFLLFFVICILSTLSVRKLV
jgi:hypothetical protein